MALSEFKAFMARLERLETQAAEPDPRLQAWLATIDDDDLERLVELQKRAQAGGSFTDDAELHWYESLTADAPAGIFPTTGE
jgi:hypothetical protein